ncbi:MAG: tyrosine-type recombinase/integrase [Bacteroidales bacterium]|nr:tyrosine-type recombinase/integrase [Bacteroidales bacterium]MBP5682002.1 tyrosine-type recombinase/integrase [Bacteroidales bacterium]
MRDEIYRFRDYLMHERRYSAHTVKAYVADMEAYAEYCMNVAPDVELSDIEPKVVRKWVMSLKAEGLNATSINRKISTVRGFYRWMLKKSLILRSPVQGLKNIRKPRRLPEFVTEDKMDDILGDDAAFADSKNGGRDRLIIELFYDTGIRESELIELKCGDVDLSRRTITVHGKGGKTRMVPISESLCKRLADIMTSPEESLFKTDKGSKMYPRLVYRIVHKYLEGAGSVSQSSPHTLRHSFATAMLNNGAPIEAIKELLGHANLTATQIYTHTTYEKLNKIYKQAHPRA